MSWLADHGETPLHVAGKRLELPDKSAASSKQILDRPIVALEALVDEIADALVLDAERRALPEVEQPREPLVQYNLEKVELFRDCPVVRPDRRRKQHEAVHVGDLRGDVELDIDE